MYTVLCMYTIIVHCSYACLTDSICQHDCLDVRKCIRDVVLSLLDVRQNIYAFIDLNGIRF